MVSMILLFLIFFLFIYNHVQLFISYSRSSLDCEEKLLAWLFFFILETENFKATVTHDKLGT